MAIVQVSIVPLGTGGSSLSPYVARVVQWLVDNGINYKLTPMGTVLEGELSELLGVINQLHEIPFEEGAQRVMTLINIDDRRDRKAAADGKIKSVEARLKK